jgi:beta-mannosidase
MFQSNTDSTAHKAEVPGNIHTDLCRNNLISNPFYSNNELSLKWIENENWIYKTEFLLTRYQLNSDVINLIFNGLDTYAEIYLNNQHIGSSNNMFTQFKLNIKSLAKEKNYLTIHFASAIKTAEPLYDAQSPRLPADNDRNIKATSIFTRKAPYQYGWDWGPRMVGAGIWQPVFIETWNRAEMVESRVSQQSLSQENAIVNFSTRLNAFDGFRAKLRIFQGDELLLSKDIDLNAGINQITESFEIQNPKLWWPNGYGEAYLYTFKVLLETNGLLWEDYFSLGLRTIELERTNDSIGQSFRFLVNKTPIYAKGANYIPQDVFPSNVRDDDYRTLLTQVKNANMNMLRVWGGGIYENDVFYRLCDELGIMVWQDFMFACSLYPADSAFVNNVSSEAQFQIKRLRDHASLALWCGNNEINELWHNWGYRKAYQYSYQDSVNVWADYQKIFNGLLPRLVNEFNPETSYLESSPAIGWGHNESMNTGDSHYWGIWWGKQPFEKYEEKIPRFSSEFGFQSLPHLNTILSFTDSSQLNLFSDDLKTHQKSSIGNQTILEYLPQYFPEPKTFEELIYVSQLLQAYGMDVAFRAQRLAKPRCMGTLYWQLNDCWPGLSWSSMDYYKQQKATHYVAREDFANFLVQSEIRDKMLLTKLVSDSLKDIKAELTVCVITFSGDTIKHHSREILVQAEKVQTIELIPFNLRQIDPSKALIYSELKIGNTILASHFHFFGKPKNLNFPTRELQLKHVADNEFLVSSSADVFHYKVYLSTEEYGNFEPNFFHLLPGEKKKVKFIPNTKNTILKKEEIRLMSLNQVK